MLSKALCSLLKAQSSSLTASPYTASDSDVKLNPLMRIGGTMLF